MTQTNVRFRRTSITVIIRHAEIFPQAAADAADKVGDKNDFDWATITYNNQPP